MRLRLFRTNPGEFLRRHVDPTQGPFFFCLKRDMSAHTGVQRQNMEKSDLSAALDSIKNAWSPKSDGRWFRSFWENQSRFCSRTHKMSEFSLPRPPTGSSPPHTQQDGHSASGHMNESSILAGFLATKIHLKSAVFPHSVDNFAHNH